MPLSKRMGRGRSTSFSSVISSLEKERDAANKANLARLQEAKGLYDRIIGQYEPGGGFGQGVEARLERLKTQTMASGMQNLVASGLANTTMAANIGTAFAEDVAAPAMLQLEDLRTQRLSAALEGKANLLSMVEDIGPSSDLIAQLSMQSGYGSGGGIQLSPRAAAGLDVFGQPLGKYTGGSASRTPSISQTIKQATTPTISQEKYVKQVLANRK